MVPVLPVFQKKMYTITLKTVNQLESLEKTRIKLKEILVGVMTDKSKVVKLTGFEKI